MAQTDHVVPIRGILGINRQEDSRQGDPGSWYTTQNLYARSPGVLAKRPGSNVLVLPQNAVAPGSNPVAVTSANLGAGEILDFAGVDYDAIWAEAARLINEALRDS